MNYLQCKPRSVPCLVPVRVSRRPFRGVKKTVALNVHGRPLGPSKRGRRCILQRRKPTAAMRPILRLELSEGEDCNRCISAVLRTAIQLPWNDSSRVTNLKQPDSALGRKRIPMRNHNASHISPPTKSLPHFHTQNPSPSPTALGRKHLAVLLPSENNL